MRWKGDMVFIMTNERRKTLRIPVYLKVRAWGYLVIY